MPVFTNVSFLTIDLCFKQLNSVDNLLDICIHYCIIDLKMYCRELVVIKSTCNNQESIVYINK